MKGVTRKPFIKMEELRVTITVQLGVPSHEDVKREY